jgi:hypothetical protein
MDNGRIMTHIYRGLEGIESWQTRSCFFLFVLFSPLHFGSIKMRRRCCLGMAGHCMALRLRCLGIYHFSMADRIYPYVLLSVVPPETKRDLIESISSHSPHDETVPANMCVFIICVVHSNYKLLHAGFRVQAHELQRKTFIIDLLKCWPWYLVYSSIMISINYKPLESVCPTETCHAGGHVSK